MFQTTNQITRPSVGLIRDILLYYMVYNYTSHGFLQSLRNLKQGGGRTLREQLIVIPKIDKFSL